MAARTCTLMVAVLLMAGAMVLMMAALSYDQWFSTNEVHETIQDGVSYTLNLRASLDPFRTSWYVSTYNSTQSTPHVESYSGKIKDLCAIPVVQDILADTSSCRYIETAGPAVAAMGILSVIFQGVAAAFVLTGILRKIGSKCYGFIQEVMVFFAFLCTLIVSALWGAVATLGKDKLNAEIPKFFEERLGVPMSGSGSFHAQGSLWLAVGAVIPSLIALCLTTAACCCMKNYYNEKYGRMDANREKSREKNFRDIERLEKELGRARRV